MTPWMTNMFQMKISQKNKNKKLGSYQKSDKFVSNKTIIFFYEIKTTLSVDSFYFSCYPFRKSPEWDPKNGAARKKIKRLNI